MKSIRRSSWFFQNQTTASIPGRPYLSKGGQGPAGSWVWIGVGDVEELYKELKANGAKIRQEPMNYPWALEIRVEDLDGNVLRMGSDSNKGRP